MTFKSYPGHAVSTVDVKTVNVNCLCQGGSVFTLVGLSACLPLSFLTDKLVDRFYET